MAILEDEDAFRDYPAYRWVYNKYDISLLQGLKCGVLGEEVPETGLYVIKPMVNLWGMGLGVTLRKFHEGEEAFISPGHFFCEKLQGRHFTIDYHWGEPQELIEGTQDPTRFSRFVRWDKIDEPPPQVPDFLLPVINSVEYVNLEYIENTVIDVHLRPNPDFLCHKSPYVKVVTDRRTQHMSPDEVFIEDRCMYRLGFYVKRNC